MKLWYVVHIWQEHNPTYKIRATFVTYGATQEDALIRVQRKRGRKGEWLAMECEPGFAQLSVSF